MQVHAGKQEESNINIFNYSNIHAVIRYALIMHAPYIILVTCMQCYFIHCLYPVIDYNTISIVYVSSHRYRYIGTSHALVVINKA